MASLEDTLKFLSLPSACPLCIVALDAATGQPIAINSTFESVMGPLYKFNEWEFANAASDDEELPPTADGRKRKHINENRTKFRSAINEVRDSINNNNNSGSSSGRIRNIEMLTLSSDNSGLPVRKFFDWTIGSVQNSSHSTIILYGDVVNEVESSNRARDEELIDFFQNAPIAMHWLNSDGTVLWANQTELNVLGYTPEEYIGKPIMQFCPDEQELVLEIFKQLGSGNAIADVPVRFRTKDGKLVHLLIDSNVAYNKDGSFGHTRCFIRDDTARKIRDARSKLLLEETERSLRMLDGFLSRTLHHVMGPLHALRGTCEVVRDNLSSAEDDSPVGEKNCDLLERAADTVMSTTRMVADVSDLARFDEGASLKTKFGPLDLRDIGTQAIENVQFNSLRMSGGDDGISVSLSLVGGGGPAVIQSDSKVLLRAIAHLLDNAVREASSGGKVLLQVSSSDSHVLVEVIDDGKGLPEGTCLDQGTIGSKNRKPAPSSRYVSLNLSSKDPDQIKNARIAMEAELKDLKQNGVGVGLPLTYHLVNALGGELRHDSSFAKGTRVWFALPVNQEGGMDEDVTTTLKTETIAKQGIQPPANISFNTKPAERRIDGASFAKFASDGSTSVTSNTSGDDTLETKSMTVEPAAQAVASCGVKASLPFSVLIVEDTDICARLLAMQLKKLKCSTQRAENGQVAINLLKESLPGTFDLVLMDLRMPVMDGLEATKLIRKELNLTLPVVALTGELSQDIKSECEGIGFDGFYSKPLKKDTLQEVISTYKDRLVGGE